MSVFGGGFGRAVAGGLQGYASSGNVYGAAAGAAGGYLSKPEKPPSQPSAPKAPKPAPDLSNFQNQRPKALDGSPTFLQTSGGLNSAMTPVQQRAQIATQATAGDSSAYRDPEVMEYYRKLALTSLTHPSGSVNPSASVLPIEREYMTRVLGGSPRNESTASFLSALLRL